MAEGIPGETTRSTENHGILRRTASMIPLSVWLIVPVEIILIFLLIAPSLISIWLSLVSWQPTFGIGILAAKFIWFKNYIELFTDSRFLWAFFRTFYITATCVFLEFLIGLGLALLVEKTLPLRKLLILILILPMMFPPLVTGNSFFMLFVSEGPINRIITLVLGIPFKFDWLSSPTYAIYPIMIGEIWQWYPLMFLIMVSGLRGLPPNQLHAADVLGASRWDLFWRIKLPLLKPIILIAIVIRAMEVIKLFDLIYIMTRGGPGTATENINLYMYKIGLKDYRFSYVSAGAWLVLIASVIIFVYLLKPLLHKVGESDPRTEEAK